MRRKRYSAEFKKEAARLMIMEGLSGSEVSEKLGVNAHMLYRWKRQHLKELEGAQKKRFKPLGSDSRHDFGYSPNRFLPPMGGSQEAACLTWN